MPLCARTGGEPSGSFIRISQGRECEAGNGRAACEVVVAAGVTKVVVMDVHEDLEAIKEAQARVEVRQRLEKWETFLIIGLFVIVIGFLLSRFA